MKLLDRAGKRVMQAFDTNTKPKHVRAFLKCSTPARIANLLRVQWAVRTGRTQDFGHPYVLNVEPTNHCNLSCPLCPTGRGLVGRPKQVLSVEAFQRLIDEVGRYVYLLNLQNWGEPLLVKTIVEMIRYAHAARIYTTVSSNGNYPTRLNPELVDAHLDHVTFAVDGATQETYERYRVGGKLDTVCRNIEDLLRQREKAKARHPFVELQFLVFDHNRDDLPAIERLAASLGVDGLLVMAAVAPDNDPNRKRHYSWNTNRGFCPKFWYTATLNSDGGVTPCCNFFYREDDLGNALETSFSEVWNGPAYRHNRRVVASGNTDELHPLCAACQVYGGELGASRYGVAKPR